MPAGHVSQSGSCVDVCFMRVVDSSSMISVGASDTCALALALARALIDLTKQHVPWHPTSNCSEPSARPQTWMLHLRTCLILNLS